MPHFLTYLPIIIFLLGGYQGGFSQSAEDLNIPQAEFGDIPDSLLEMQEYSADPSAPYFYAFKEVRISFEEDDKSIVAHHTYHVRIKVFDSDAKEASIIAIPYYFENEIETVESIRGYTYQPDGSRTALNQSQVRTINLNARYNVKEFAMPEVRDGSIIEYTYKIRRRFIEELPDFYLSHKAPTDIAKVTIQYPRYLRYDVVTTDFGGEIRHVEQRIDTSSVPKVFSLPRPDPLVLDHRIARKIPAIEEEAFISSIDDYRGKLKFQLREFGIPRQTLDNSWDLVVARIRKEQNPWSVIEKNDRARQLGKRIADQHDDPEAVQDSIFHYLNQNVRFNESHGSYSETPDDSVLSQKLVSQPAINQALIAMLEGAGIKAWPLLISSRQFGRINRSFPSWFQFNSQVVCSEVNGKQYFMDASFPNSFPNLLPVESYNETGLILKKNSYDWIEIKPGNSVFAIKIQLTGKLNRDGGLSGTVLTSHFGYPAQLIREKAANGEEPQNIIREVLFDGYADIELRNLRIQNLKQYRDSVKMRADFDIKQYATSFTDALEYRPMVVGYLMSNPFDEGKRELPVTLDAPEKLDLTYEIEMPEGYSLGSGSQNRTIELPGAKLEEQYRLQRENIRYEFHIDIGRKQFEPEIYPQLLDLYERWVELSNMIWQIKKQ